MNAGGNPDGSFATIYYYVPLWGWAMMGAGLVFVLLLLLLLITILLVGQRRGRGGDTETGMKLPSGHPPLTPSPVARVTGSPRSFQMDKPLPVPVSDTSDTLSPRR